MSKHTPFLYATNFAEWKKPFYRRVLFRSGVCFFRKKAPAIWLRCRFLFARPAAFCVWGMYRNPWLERYAAKKGLDIIRVEDGFVRSVGLGSSYIHPLSYCTDRSGIYYDATHPSDLEILLSSHDFTGDPTLMEQAQKCLDFIITHGITKYNLPAESTAEQCYGAKQGTRILCIGQVEEDASIEYGYQGKICNNDLVRMAAQENPGAQIIYKIHPDIASQNRQNPDNPEVVSAIATVVSKQMPPSEMFVGVDRVYTITSLAGFEALIRGVAVTCLGMPFYAGWGVTDDRQPCPRRTRTLSLLEVFAAAYVLYPHYVDPENGKACTLMETLRHIQNKRRDIPVDDAA